MAYALKIIKVSTSDAYDYQVGYTGVRAGCASRSTLYPIIKRLGTDGLVTTQWRDGDLGLGR